MKKRTIAIVGVVVLIIIAAVTVTVVLVTKDDDDKEDNVATTITTTTDYFSTTTVEPEIPNPNEPPGPSWFDYGLYQNAAISCDANCSYIGEDILQNKNGNIVDAAIAILLCMGVLHSQSMGIGGGFLMVIYDAKTKNSTILNAREVAPLAATEDMYHGNSSLSQKGGLAVAVPGEIKGYWELYKAKGSGNVPWADLFQPTIKICEEGFLVDNHTANALKGQRDNILKEPSMAEIFVDPLTNDVYVLGDTIKRPQLANTFKIIAQYTGDALYDNSVHNLSSWFVEDLKAMGGIMTQQDLLDYKVDWPEPLVVNITGGFQLHAVPPPGSGALSAFMMRLLGAVGLDRMSLSSTEESIKVYHLITEAMKHAYAQRTKLGDPSDLEVEAEVKALVQNLTMSEDYLDAIIKLVKEGETNNTVEYYGAEYYTPDDHGTAHMSIVGANGDAIAVTSTVNLYFGAGIRSPRTGIIYNDEMDDFSAPNITNAFGVPPSPNNFIKPGKRPLSSMTPSIFTNPDGSVRLAVGTAGGTKITTTTTYVAIRNLWFNETIKEAIDARRIHHQLFPMELEYEFGFIDPWVQGLDAIGHITKRFNIGASVANGVARYDNGTLSANWDFRKPGSIGGY